MKEQPRTPKKVSPSQVRRRRRRAQARQEAAKRECNAENASAEDVNSSLLEVDTSDRSVSEEDASLLEMNTGNNGNDKPHEAEEADDDVDAMESLGQDILQSSFHDQAMKESVNMDTDEIDLGMLLENVIKQSKRNRRLWKNTLT